MDKLKQIYEDLKSDNYDVPDFDTFKSTLSKESNRKIFYEDLKSGNYDVPDYDRFNTTLFGTSDDKPDAQPIVKSGKATTSILDAEELGHIGSSGQVPIVPTATPPSTRDSVSDTAPQNGYGVGTTGIPYVSPLAPPLIATPEKEAPQVSLNKFKPQQLKPNSEWHVESAIKDTFSEERKKAEAELSAVENAKNAGSAFVPHFAQGINAAIDIEKYTDPQKVINATIKRVLPKIKDDINREVQNGANAEDITNRYASYIQDMLVNEYVNERIPKESAEYIAGSAMRDNILSNLMSGVARIGAGSSGINSDIDTAAYGAYNPNMSDKISAGVSTLLADAPIFALTGGIGGLASKGLIKAGGNMLTKGVAKSGLSTLGKRTLVNAGERMFSSGVGGRLTAGAVSGAVNLGSYDVIGESSRQLESGNYDLGAIGKRGLHGVALGGATAPIGILGKYITRGESALIKAGTDVSAFGLESGVFAMPSLMEMKKAGKNITWGNVGEEFAISAATLGMMKVAHSPKLRKEIKDRYASDGVGNMQLNKSELDFLDKNGYNFGDLFKTEKLDQTERLRAIDGGVVELASSEKNNHSGFSEGIMKLNDTVVKDAELSNSEKTLAETEVFENYERAINDNNIPIATRRKLMYGIEGKLYSGVPVVYGVKIEDMPDSKGSVVTPLNERGIPIERIEYSSKEKAKRKVAELEDIGEKNSIEALENVVDGYAEKQAVYKACAESPNGEWLYKEYDRISKTPEKERTVEDQNLYAGVVEKAEKLYDKENSSSGVREQAQEFGGVDIEKAILKPRSKRTKHEQDVINDYADVLRSKVIKPQTNEERGVSVVGKMRNGSEVSIVSGEVKRIKGGAVENKEDRVYYEKDGKVEVAQAVDFVSEVETPIATVDDMISLNGVEGAGAEYIREHRKENAEPVAKLQKELEAVMSYTGEGAEPANYDYWAGRLGVERITPLPTDQVDARDENKMGNDLTVTENDVPLGLTNNLEDGISERISQGEHGTQAKEDGRVEELANRLRGRSGTPQGDTAEVEDSGRNLSRQEKKDEDARIAVDYAKETGAWYPDIYDLGVPFSSGNENTVVVNKDEGVVYKINNLMNSQTVSDLLDRVKIHNEVFPDTRYDFVGISGADFGKRAHAEPVFKQRLIKDAVEASYDDISGYMDKLGFKQVSDFVYRNGVYEISDMRPRNVLKDKDGDIYVIDAGCRRLSERERYEGMDEEARNRHLLDIADSSKGNGMERSKRLAEVDEVKGYASYKSVKKGLNKKLDELEQIDESDYDKYLRVQANDIPNVKREIASVDDAMRELEAKHGAENLVPEMTSYKGEKIRTLKELSTVIDKREPQTLREYILREMIGTKLRWSDARNGDGVVTSRGFGKETGWGAGEKRVFQWVLSEDGMTPDQFAHAIMESDVSHLLNGKDISDVKNEILSVVGELGERTVTAKRIAEKLVNEWDVQDKAYDEAMRQEYLDTRHGEWRQELLNRGVDIDKVADVDGEFKKWLVEREAMDELVPAVDKRAEKLLDMERAERELGVNADGNSINEDAATALSALPSSIDANKDGEVVGEKQVEDVKSEGIVDNIASEREKVNTNPTEAQKEAGNYKKGHVRIDGMDITIENPKDSERSGIDTNGKAWSITMNNDYGYILGTKGVDGDHIDMFISDNPESGDIYVVDQINTDGSFDEHKVMYGFTDASQAKHAYLSNYENGWKGLGVITKVSKEGFKKWIESSHRKTKPFAEYKIAKEKSDGLEANAEELDYLSYEHIEAKRVAGEVHEERLADIADMEVSDAEREVAYADEVARYESELTEERKRYDDAVKEQLSVLGDEKDDGIRYREGELADEYTKIVGRAKADGTFMKAPNGEATNLNEHQWVQVRTKAFKNWFGDWEKSARIEKLRNSIPVEISGTEYEGKYDLNRNSAKAWIKENLRGEYMNKDSGDLIKLSRKGADKVTSHGMGSDAHLKSIVAIPELVENSIFIAELPNEKDNGKYDSYRYYVCGLKINGLDYTVKLTVGVKDGKQYYDHALTEIEKGKLLETISLNGFKTKGDAPVLSSTDTKDTKLVSLLQGNSSKVLDANGEPIVIDDVYIRYNADVKGFFDKRISAVRRDVEAVKKIAERKGLVYESTDFYMNDDIEAIIDSMRRSDNYLNLFDYLYRHESDPTIRITMRYGHAPEGGSSYNFASGFKEKGVSMVGRVSDISNNVNWFYDSFFGNKPYLIFCGLDLGHIGSDGELLLSYVSELGGNIGDVCKSATDNNGEFSKENDDIRYRSDKKSATSDRTGAVAGTSSSDSLNPSGVVRLIRQPRTHKDSATKVDNDTDTAKRKVQKLKNEGYKFEKGTTSNAIVRNLGNKIGLDRSASSNSYYGEYEIGGKRVKLRLSTHPANGARMGGSEFDERVSVVVYKNGEHKGDNVADYVEYTYHVEKSTPEDVVKSIIDGVDSLLSGNGFVDSGVAEKVEYRGKDAEVVNEVTELSHEYGVEIDVVSDVSGMPDNSAKRAVEKGRNIKGWYDSKSGKIVIYLPNTVDVQDVRDTFFHEAIGHKGIKEFMGEKKHNELLDGVYELAVGDGAMPSPIGVSKAERRRIADEYIADTAEAVFGNKADDNILNRWDRIVGAVRDFLRKLFKVKFSAKDVEYLLWRASRGMRGTDKGVVFEAENISRKSEALKMREAERVDDIVSRLKENAEPMPELELTPDNWKREFGTEGKVSTPIGEVKMGENQYEKLDNDARRITLGMVKPTLERPDVIIEEKSGNELAERNSSYVFVKTFLKPDGNKHYFFTSVTVRQEGMEVSISNHIVRPNRLKEIIRDGRLIHLKDAALPPETTLSVQGNQPTQPSGASLFENKVSEDVLDLQEKGEKDDGILFREGKGINKREQKLRDDVTEMKERLRDNKESVALTVKVLNEFIKENLSVELSREAGKGEITSILSALRDAVTHKGVGEAMRRIEHVVNGVETRMGLKELDKLMKIKVDGLTPKGVVKAQYVDSYARTIIENVRNVFRNGLRDSIERDIWEKEKQIATLETSGGDVNTTNVLRDEIIELEVRKEYYSIVGNSYGAKEIEERKAKVETTIADKYYKNIPVSIEEKAELASMPLLERLGEVKDALNNVANLKEDIKRLITERKKLKPLSSDEAEERESKRKRRIEINCEIGVLDYDCLAYEEDVNSTISFINKEMRDIIDTGHSALLDWSSDKIAYNEDMLKEVWNAVSDKPVKGMFENDKSSKPTKKPKDMYDNFVHGMFFSPLVNFNFLTKYIEKGTSYTGEGVVYNRLMKHPERGYIACEGRRVSGIREITEDVKGALKLYVGKHDNTKEQSITFTTRDRDGEILDSWGQHLNIEQACAVWAWSRMESGKLKLENQGIDEASLNQIKGFIGDGYVKFFNWLQDGYLPKLRRDRYNPVHERVYGRSLGEIPHYFPFRIYKESLPTKKKLGEIKRSKTLGIISGNIIKRTDNKLPLDLTIGFSDILENYIKDNELWVNFAELTQDVQTIVYNKHFEALLEANKQGLHEDFHEAAMIALHSYRDDVGGKPVNDFIVKLNKGVAGGKIAWRLGTAFKQILSAPAFMTYSLNPKFQAELDYVFLNPINWSKHLKWAYNNMPLFRDRWDNGSLGNPIFADKSFKWLDNYLKIGMIPNKIIDSFTCGLGAKAIYNHKFRELKEIYTEDIAHKMAIIEGEIAFNESQQSAVSAFLNPMQSSGAALNKGLTNFLNQNIANYSMMRAGQIDRGRATKYILKDRKDGYAYKKWAESNFKAGFYGWISQLLWAVAGGGILGSIYGSLKEEDYENLIKQVAFAPIQGTVLGNAASTALNYDKWEPLILIADINEVVKSINRIDESAPAYAYTQMVIACLNLTGINAVAFQNMVSAIERTPEYGIDPITFSLFVSSSRGERGSYARDYYLDHTNNIKDYVNACANAESLCEYGETGIFKATLSDKRRNEYVELWFNNKFPEYAKLEEEEKKRKEIVDAEVLADEKNLHNAVTHDRLLNRIKKIAERNNIRSAKYDRLNNRLRKVKLACKIGDWKAAEDAMK